MNKKFIYIFSLCCFFLLLGVSGFRAVALAREPDFQSTLRPDETVPAATSAGQIPVTGEPEPLWPEILLFYGLIAVTALFLILVLLNTVNKSMIPRAHIKKPSSKETHET
jgi:hypothetical protein